MTSPRALLRDQLRQGRRGIAERTQLAAASAVSASFVSITEEPVPAVVAAYLATDGELSPAPLVERARAAGSRTVFPRIFDDAMTFHFVDGDEDLVAGKWGLLEPTHDAPLVSARDIDVVLVPLVGFDAELNRMGRGKAYYDRAFAFLAAGPRPTSPHLVGLAHDLQRVDRLDTQNHDIPLDAVLTPSAVYGTLPR